MKGLFNKKGLTLVELIVTLAVLGIVVSPLMGMFITSQKINKESDEEYKTLQLAQKYMEDIKAAPVFHAIDYSEITEEGVTKYKKNDISDGNYLVDITVIPKEAINVGNTAIAFNPVLRITNSEVLFNGRTIPINDAIVDITKTPNKITVAGNPFTLASGEDNINVIIDTSEDSGVTPVAILNFINCSGTGKVYILENGRKWNISVFGGASPEVVSVSGYNVGEILYNIEIVISKQEGFIKKPVNKLVSTTIFN